MAKVFCLLIIICFTVQSFAQPIIKVSSVVLAGESAGTCPSQEMLNASKRALKEDIANLLQANSVFHNCPCGGPGQWTKIAHLSMSDPSQQCPSNWNLITTPVRGCGRTSRGCYSATFPSHGQSYSQVCGRVIAYQKGTTDAFRYARLEQTDIDGVSITHGPAGSRQHIWSFLAARYETNIPNYFARSNCPCTNINEAWPFQVPSFIGNDYFCDTGNPGPGSDAATTYTDDPLWDGEGCGSTNTCCELNNPPWFCTTLPQPTTDDLEIRNCASNTPAQEDSIISLIDIYTM